MLVNGVDVRDLDPALLARTVGLVPQKPYLFSGTVGVQPAVRQPGRDRRGALARARRRAGPRLRRARCRSGSDAPIAQGGTNVSGGQRQRLAIARMLVAKPEIYLFDDSFSALDYATDAALRAALAHETADATVVIVAQRVSTIRDADRIVVLDEGRVVGTGTHTDLMQTTRPTGRSCCPSSPKRRQQHERAGNGASASPTAPPQRRTAPAHRTGPSSPAREAAGGAATLSTQTNAASRPTGARFGPGMFAGGPAAKALDFKGSSRRLLRMMAPQRVLIVRAAQPRRRSASRCPCSARRSSGTPPT